MANAVTVRNVSVLQLAERPKQLPRSGTVTAVTIYARHDLLLLLNMTATESDVLLGFIKVGPVAFRGPCRGGLYINTIMSPIPTRVYMPITAAPRQTSAMTLSDGNLNSLADNGTSLRNGSAPMVQPQRHHARGRESFRGNCTKVNKGLGPYFGGC